MKYARLENDELIPAPKTVIINDLTICNPTSEQYLSIGWYPVIFTEPPDIMEDSSDMPVSHWEFKNEKIVQKWEILPISIEPDPEMLYWTQTSYNDLVNNEIRKKYSISEEFAILRQKENKLGEYITYNNYCEECKKFVKSKLAEYGIIVN